MRFVGTFVAITFCFCSLSELTSSIQASDPPKPGGLVATELSQVDHDYHTQGEYMGYVSERAGSSYVKKFGLQIVAR
ncbi:MAG: hypothetical protein JKY95_15980, partial [Planctomycetaceae bacterium]|nr:hypothetical protein [Planctomycetaceae bacterium]